MSSYSEMREILQSLQEQLTTIQQEIKSYKDWLNSFQTEISFYLQRMMPGAKECVICRYHDIKFIICETCYQEHCIECNTKLVTSKCPYCRGVL